MKNIEDLSKNWTCKCGNKTVTSEWKKGNIQVFRCSKCNNKVAYRIW